MRTTPNNRSGAFDKRSTLEVVVDDARSNRRALAAWLASLFALATACGSETFGSASAADAGAVDASTDGFTDALVSSPGCAAFPAARFCENFDALTAFDPRFDGIEAINGEASRFVLDDVLSFSPKKSMRIAVPSGSGAYFIKKAFSSGPENVTLSFRYRLGAVPTRTDDEGVTLAIVRMVFGEDINSVFLEADQLGRVTLKEGPGFKYTQGPTLPATQWSSARIEVDRTKAQIRWTIDGTTKETPIVSLGPAALTRIDLGPFYMKDVPFALQVHYDDVLVE